MLTTAVAALAHLPRAAVAAQLGDRLVDQAHAVRPPMGQLAAMRVEREITVEGDALARVEEVLGFADPAEAERLDPCHAIEGEPVVELSHVHVGRAEIGTAPQVRGRTEHLWLVAEHALVPLQALGDLHAHRLDTTTGWGRSPAASRAETTTATAPSHRGSQSSSPSGELIGAGAEVVLHRQRVAEHAVGIAAQRWPGR